MSAPKKVISLAGLAAAFAAAEAWIAVHPEAEALVAKLESEGVAWLTAWVAARTAAPAAPSAPAA